MLTVVQVEEKSNTACAVTGSRELVYLAWAGSDLHLNVASSPDGQTFAGKQRLAYESYVRRESTDLFDSSKTSTTWVPLPPALAAYGERIYLAWAAPNGALGVVVAERGAFSAPVTFKERTGTSPSLATSQHGLTLAWIGTDRRVNLLTLVQDWSGQKVRLEEAKSDAAPAVCTHRGGLVVAWTGTDRRVNLATLTDGGLTQPIRLEAKSDAAPAVCSHRDRLVVAWTGTDRRVNLLTLADGGPTRPVRLEETKTAAAPSLCSYRDTLLVAWAGKGRRLYVGHVEDRVV
jgi:WD40 repeat protein